MKLKLLVAALAAALIGVVPAGAQPYPGDIPLEKKRVPKGALRIVDARVHQLFSAPDSPYYLVLTDVKGETATISLDVGINVVDVVKHDEPEGTFLGPGLLVDGKRRYSIYVPNAEARLEWQKILWRYKSPPSDVRPRVITRP
jgi:hypothetical protein